MLEQLGALMLPPQGGRYGWARLRTPSPDWRPHAAPVGPLFWAPVFVPHMYVPEQMAWQPYAAACAEGAAEASVDEAEAVELVILDDDEDDDVDGAVSEAAPTKAAAAKAAGERAKEGAAQAAAPLSDALSEAETADVAGSEDSCCLSTSSCADSSPELPDGLPSLGSARHPHACGPPCKYVQRASGCKDGHNCSHCHICRWQSRRHGKCKHKTPKMIPEDAALSPSCA